LFSQMVYLMKWAKSKNPHLIVVIENPQAQMQKSPDMIDFMETFGLHKATVNYCAFGRLDKKPTNLWTNVSFILLAALVDQPRPVAFFFSISTFFCFSVSYRHE
jgi:hypothetical protein